MSTARHDVVVVGGGAAGMAAAWELRDKDVLLLEADDVLGGRLKSLGRGEYWLNLGGHMFPSEGARVRRLIADLGLETVDITGSKTALGFAGQIYDSRRIESYPFILPLSLRERVGLVRAGLIIRLKARQWFSVLRARPGETEAERRARVARFENDRTFADLLGHLPARVEDIFRTAARRAPGEAEELTAGAGIILFANNWAGRASGAPVNLRGGSGRLGEAVARRLGERVVLGARVTSVEPDGAGAVVHYETAAGPTRVAARRVVVATPAPVALGLVPGLPADVVADLESVRYGTFVSMAVLTTETGPMPWDDLYAVLTPGRSFNMVFNHANPLRDPSGDPSRRAAGGSLMCYAGGRPGTELLDVPDDEVRRRFLADLHDLYPQLDGLVGETVVQRWRHGNCYRRPGTTFDAMARYARDASHVVQFAGDYFAEVSGTIEDATRSGTAAARVVASALDPPLALVQDA